MCIRDRILTVNGKNVRITIPAGVANGQVIKLKGYGGEGINGGPAGDLDVYKRQLYRRVVLCW